MASGRADGGGVETPLRVVRAPVEYPRCGPGDVRVMHMEPRISQDERRRAGSNDSFLDPTDLGVIMPG